MAKKKKGGGGGGGGHDAAGGMRWLLTYADMITLLLIFFIIMYSVAAQDQEQIKKLLEMLRATFGGIVTGGQAMLNSGSSSEKAAFAINSDRIQLPQAQQKVIANIKHAIEEKGWQKKVMVRLNERGLVISLMTDDLTFQKGSAQLTPDAKNIVREVADNIKDLPNQIAIEGHTDDTPTKGRAYPSNWELSTARAATVVRQLVDKEHLEPTRLSAAGYAQYRPLIRNTNDQSRSYNRRVDIVVLKLEASKLEAPKVDESMILQPEEPIQINWKK